MRSAFLVIGAVLALSACGTTYNVPQSGLGGSGSATTVEQGSDRNRSHYTEVRRRVKPVAEAFCREEAPGAPAKYCDIRFEFDPDRKTPPNAYQTIGPDGRPVIIMTASLLDQMRTNDEIAMVMSHEAAHHIAQHIPKQQQNQILGGMLLGGLTAVIGGEMATQSDIEQAMNIGASLGGRVYSQSYELEADWLGAFIAARAGYDPERGAQIFGRPALASNATGSVLSTHPASPQRRELITRASQEIRRQQAAGLVPRPEQVN